MSEHTTPVSALDRGDAVNLARNVMGFSECPALTPKGQLCLAKAVLKMDAELTRLGTRSETEFRHVWAVENKTTFVLFSTEEAARAYVSSFPTSVGGGMSIAKLTVLGPMK